VRVGVEYMPGANVGDGIYQLSVLGLMQAAFPDAEVMRVDGPLFKTFPNRPHLVTRTRLAGRGFEITPYYDLDCLCFSGPILGDDFIRLYGPAIRAVRDRGGSYLIVSAHCPAYSETLIDFLRREPPLAISTRDTPSYVVLSSCDAPVYDGVCAALLVSQTCRPPSVSTALGPYITVSCDKGFEPRVSFALDEAGEVDLDTVNVGHYEGRSRWRYIRHLEFARPVASSVTGCQIIRPVHDISYKFSHLNFAKAQAFLSYLPESYLALYRSTHLTVSDRVHSCAPTLSYGKPAVFLGNTPRAAIFDRVGAVAGSNGVMKVDLATIEKEYDALLGWFRSIL
jgi:hypothetical protein